MFLNSNTSIEVAIFYYNQNASTPGDRNRLKYILEPFLIDDIKITDRNNLTVFDSFPFNLPSWPILFMLFFTFVGFVGNLLVCLAIKIDPKLQNATNYYLFSLACTDLLVSVILIPLNILKNYYNLWILGNLACMLFVFLDVFLCTTSILLLCIISCERYIGIKDPLKNREKSKSKTKIIISLTWITSFFLSSPVLFLGYLNPRNIIQNGNCGLFNDHFIIYGSIISFIIPLFVMILMYILTVHRLQIVLKEYTDKSSKPVSGTFQSSSLKLTKYSFKEKQDEKKNKTEFAKSQENLLLTKSIFFKTVLQKENLSKELGSSKIYSQNSLIRTPESPEKDEHAPKAKFKTLVNKHRLLNKTVSAFQTNRDTTVVKNEEKAVKVLGIVFVVFVIAWAPFAVFNILSAICKTCSIYPSFLNILTWLGYISSSINPIIYNAFNEKFRYAFKQILKCRLKSLRKHSFKKQHKLFAKLAAENLRSSTRQSYCASSNKQIN